MTRFWPTRSAKNMVVDTGAWYAVADASDRHHVAARRFYLDQAPSGSFVTTDLILAETRVAVTTLDDEVRELGLVPTFVKIDVEGAELDVLKGAAHVLARHRPRLLLSLHPRRLAGVGLDCDTVRQWLTTRDYQWHVVGEDQEVHVLARPA